MTADQLTAFLLADIGAAALTFGAAAFFVWWAIHKLLGVE